MWVRDTKKDLPSLHASKNKAVDQSATGQFGGLIQMASVVGNSAMDAYLRQEITPQPTAPSSGSSGVGLQPALRERMEARFGFPLDDVRVHYDSDKPAEIGAAAYAKGNEIFLGPGQEKHLEHEATHVVQQKQGRVRSTGRIGGEAVNTASGMEDEAARGTPEMRFGDFELSENNAPIQAAFEDWVNDATITAQLKDEYMRICDTLQGLSDKLSSPDKLVRSLAENDRRKLELRGREILSQLTGAYRNKDASKREYEKGTVAQGGKGTKKIVLGRFSDTSSRPAKPKNF